MNQKSEVIIVGIDISLSSTGVCISYGGENFQYLNFLNSYKISKAKKTEDRLKNSKENETVAMLSEISNLGIVFYDREPVSQKSDYTKNQRILLENVNDFTKLFSETLLFFLKDHIGKKEIHVVIEGYDYGSQGDATIQIVELSANIKKFVIEEILLWNYERYHVYAGPTIKKFAIKGSSDKYQMFEAFLRFNQLNPKLLADPFHKKLKENQTLCWSDGSKMMYVQKLKDRVKTEIRKMKTPIDDLIDAFFLSEYLRLMILK